jgi:hypothetical protein
MSYCSSGRTVRYYSFALALFLAAIVPRIDNAQIVQFGIAPGVGYNGAYQGNPNPSILKISPGITCSRTGTLLAPAFIQCSASPTTAVCTGTLDCTNGVETNPYEDLEYTWNFGNPTGTETFINPLSGSTVNANSQQWGPEATYVYRGGGSYTITLNVRGCSNGGTVGGACSGGTYTTAAVTTTVTVNAFDPAGGEYWFAAAGNDKFGCTKLMPCRTMSELNTLIMRANNQRFHLNCGDSFTSSTGINMKARTLSYSGIRIDAAGASCPGSCPIVNISSGPNLPLNIEQSGPAIQSDIVVSGICFSNSGSATNTATVGLGPDDRTTGSIQDVYFDNVTNIDTLGTSGLNGYNIEATRYAHLRNVAIWGGTVTAPLTGRDCTGILGGSQQWYSIVGLTISGNGNNDPIRCHHIYIHGQQHILVRWSVGGRSDPTGTAPTRNYTIKTSFDGAYEAILGVPSFYAQYFLISENHFYGTTYGRNVSNVNNDPTLSRYKQIVDQQNLYDSLPGKWGTGIIQPWTAETLTERDARACNSGDIWFTPNGTGKAVYDSAQIYRNKVYNTGMAGFVAFSGVAWGDRSPLRQIVTDNDFYSSSWAPNLNAYVFRDWTSSGSVVDRNSYYAPNAVGHYLFNNATGVSFSTWQSQGWDKNGTAGRDPGWPNPSRCSFGKWPYS